MRKYFFFFPVFLSIPKVCFKEGNTERSVHWTTSALSCTVNEVIEPGFNRTTVTVADFFLKSDFPFAFIFHIVWFSNGCYIIAFQSWSTILTWCQLVTWHGKWLGHIQWHWNCKCFHDTLLICLHLYTYIHTKPPHESQIISTVLWRFPSPVSFFFFWISIFRFHSILMQPVIHSKQHLSNVYVITFTRSSNKLVVRLVCSSGRHHQASPCSQFIGDWLHIRSSGLIFDGYHTSWALLSWAAPSFAPLLSYYDLLHICLLLQEKTLKPNSFQI